MQAGNYGAVMLSVVNQLCAELGPVEAGEIPEARSRLGGQSMVTAILNVDDELAVSSVRAALAKLAAKSSGGAEPAHPAHPLAVRAALDGAEMVMRGKLLSGNGEDLPELMPSFVFLAVLPIVDQDRAFELSRRAAQLVEEEITD